MSQSFETVAALWKADKRKWVKPSSYSIYVHLLNKHLLPFFAGKDIITEADIQGYVTTKLASGLSLKSIQDSITILRMILSYGEKVGTWPHIPFEVHYPSNTEKRHDIPVLTKQQQKALHKYLQEHFSFRNLGLLICLHSGLRIGELCGLQWKDLDVSTGVLRVNKTVQRISIVDGQERVNYLSIASPKTDSSTRDVPICRELMKMIKPLKRFMQEDYYLVSNSTKPIEPRYLRAYFRKVLLELDIPPIRFHALRHSFATRCIEANCDYKTVSAILGHSSISTTLDLYVHPDNRAKRKVIERVGGMLR